MLDTLLDVIAPHLCCGCRQLGALLCDYCKYDIVSESYSACVACGVRPGGQSGVCGGCRVPYQQAWCVGERRDTLQRLIGNYKFINSRAAYRPLALLLHERLPQLPDNVIVVPIPTVASHIRQRGYDHMLLIARHLARQRRLSVSTQLVRQTATKQRDATRQQRIRQAKQAFAWRGAVDPDATYLLVDDVITTGATLRYGAQTLRSAGARHIWAAAISRQPLD